MTEDQRFAEEWDNGTYRFWISRTMEFPHRSERKMRLLAVACSRQWSDLWPSELLRAVVDRAERLAEDEVFDEEVRYLQVEGQKLATHFEINRPDDPIGLVVRAAARTLSGHGRWAALQQEFGLPEALGVRAEGYRRATTVIARCIFGNPFRPVAFSPAWRTSTAVALAAQMYESREFGAMPILADAIQDAGCDSADVLSHCRKEGPHVRGCWVVDLMLGKE